MSTQTKLLEEALAEARRALVVAEPYVATYPSGMKGISEARDVALARVRAAIRTATDAPGPEGER